MVCTATDGSGQRSTVGDQDGDELLGNIGHAVLGCTAQIELEEDARTFLPNVPRQRKVFDLPLPRAIAVIAAVRDVSMLNICASVPLLSMQRELEFSYCSRA